MLDRHWHRWDFDSLMFPYRVQLDDFRVDEKLLVPGWSGYALDRTTPSWSPVVCPGADLKDEPTWMAASGALRFWFSPSWNSGKGTGDFAHWLDSVSVAGLDVTVNWSLSVSPDGSTLALAQADGPAVAEVFQCPINFQAGEWYLIALNYSAGQTELFINGELAAKGGGLHVPAGSSAGLVAAVIGAGQDWLEGTST
jgi:hypothetical protein